VIAWQPWKREPGGTSSSFSVTSRSTRPASRLGPRLRRFGGRPILPAFFSMPEGRGGFVGGRGGSPFSRATSSRRD
jgi:hypothetical protein